MTVVAVLAEPPRPGLVLAELAGGLLSAAEAADLYGAMLRDVLVGVDASGGELLVNYRPAEGLPAAHRTDADPEAEVRAAVASALGGTDGVRFEPQVGSDLSARAGNTVGHLLREEGATSAAVVRPTAPFLARTTVDSAAMKLRSAAVVLGPAPEGRVHYAGFAEPVDFEGAFDPPALTGLTDRGRAGGHGVDFLPLAPTVRRPGDLVTLLTVLRSRRRAGRSVPEHTAAFVEDHGLGLAVEDGRPRAVRQ